MSAYMIALCEITNPGPGLKEYSEKSAQISASHGGEYLVRGPSGNVVEGDVLKGKVTIIARFPSMDALNAFYNDPDYQTIKPLREDAGNFEIAFYEGL